MRASTTSLGEKSPSTMNVAFFGSTVLDVTPFTSARASLMLLTQVLQQLWIFVISSFVTWASETLMGGKWTLSLSRSPWKPALAISSIAFLDRFVVGRR